MSKDKPSWGVYEFANGDIQRMIGMETGALKDTFNGVGVGATNQIITMNLINS